jgi:hypothetical protein
VQIERLLKRTTTSKVWSYCLVVSHQQCATLQTVQLCLVGDLLLLCNPQVLTPARSSLQSLKGSQFLVKLWEP